jgi:hypothetical protein
MILLFGIKACHSPFGGGLRGRILFLLRKIVPNLNYKAAIPFITSANFSTWILREYCSTP